MFKVSLFVFSSCATMVLSRPGFFDFLDDILPSDEVAPQWYEDLYTTSESSVTETSTHRLNSSQEPPGPSQSREDYSSGFHKGYPRRFHADYPSIPSGPQENTTSTLKDTPTGFYEGTTTSGSQNGHRISDLSSDDAFRSRMRPISRGRPYGRDQFDSYESSMEELGSHDRVTNRSNRYFPNKESFTPLPDYSDQKSLVNDDDDDSDKSEPSTLSKILNIINYVTIIYEIIKYLRR